MLDVQSDDVIQNLLDRIGMQFKGVDWKIDFVADRLTPLLEELTAEFLMKEPENLLLHAHSAGRLPGCGLSIQLALGPVYFSTHGVLHCMSTELPPH